jgi:hypothetical protein
MSARRLKVSPENVPLIKQIRSMLTDAARLTGQLSQMEQAVPCHPDTYSRISASGHISTYGALTEVEVVIDQLRRRLFELE